MKKILLAVIVVSLFAFCACDTEKSENSTSSSEGSTAAVSSEASLPDESSSESSGTSEQSESRPVILESNTMEVSTIEFSTIPAEKPFDTLEECLEQETVKETINTILEGDSELNEKYNMETEVKVEDETKLVFERKLHNTPEYPDSFIKTNEVALEQQREVFITLVDALERYINEDNITVVVRYTDNDSSVIYEKAFAYHRSGMYLDPCLSGCTL